MSADKPIGAAAGLAAVGMAVCCGLSVLLSLGAGVAIAGLGLRSWALAAAGLAALVLAVVRFRQHRSCDTAPPSERAEGAGHDGRSRTR